MKKCWHSISCALFFLTLEVSAADLVVQPVKPAVVTPAPVEIAPGFVSLKFTRIKEVGALEESEFSLPDQVVPIEKKYSTGSRLIVIVNGKFPLEAQGANLSCPTTAVCPELSLKVKSEDFTFRSFFTLTALSNEVRFDSTDSIGNTKSAKFTVKVVAGWIPKPLDPKVAAKIAAAAAQPKAAIQRFPTDHFYIGLGAAMSVYSETYTYAGFTNVSQNELGALVHLGYGAKVGDGPKTRWSYYGFASITALPVTATYATQMRFLEGGLRVGYDFASSTSMWVPSLFIGGIFMNTVVPGNTYGYSMVIGPFLYPSLVKHFKNGHSVKIFVRLTAVGGDGGYTNVMQNNEVMYGLSYRLPLSPDNYLSVNVDSANFSAFSTIPGNTTQYSSKVLGASLGVTF